MNVDFMRNVDYWIGRPICAVLSGMNKIERVFKKPDTKKPIKKILFLQISEMGSAVVAYGAVKKTEELFPDAEIHYLMFKEMSSILKILGAVKPENIHTIESKSFFKLGTSTLATLWKLRRMKFDVVIDLELFSRISNILSYLSGSRLRVGFYKFNNEGLYRGKLLTHKVEYNTYRHIGVNFLSLAYSLKQPFDEVPLTKKHIDLSMMETKKIISSNEEKENILKKLKTINPKISKKNKLVIINPNASAMLPIRKWPLDKYKELAKKLLEDESIFIIVTGTEQEKCDADDIEAFVKNNRCINFAGKTANIRELIDLYNVCDLMITNDSGPGHFATMTDMTTFVFFGPETPDLYGPVGKNIRILYSNYACSPCVSAFNSRKTPCKDNKCLQSISVEQVYDKMIK